jgi:hypothetical protein
MKKASDRDYCTVLISLAEDRDDKKATHDKVCGLHPPVPVGFFDSVQSKLESPADPTPTHGAEGAVKRCEASVKRLDHMNEILEALADEAWFSSNHGQTLAQRFKLNTYCPAIRSKLLDFSLMHQVSQRRVDGLDFAASDPRTRDKR